MRDLANGSIFKRLWRAANLLHLPVLYHVAVLFQVTRSKLPANSCDSLNWDSYHRCSACQPSAARHSSVFSSTDNIAIAGLLDGRLTRLYAPAVLSSGSANLRNHFSAALPLNAMSSIDGFCSKSALKSLHSTESVLMLASRLPGRWQCFRASHSAMRFCSSNCSRCS